MRYLSFLTVVFLISCGYDQDNQSRNQMILETKKAIKESFGDTVLYYLPIDWEKSIETIGNGGSYRLITPVLISYKSGGFQKYFFGCLYENDGRAFYTTINPSLEKVEQFLEKSH